MLHGARSSFERVRLNGSAVFRFHANSQLILPAALVVARHTVPARGSQGRGESTQKRTPAISLPVTTRLKRPTFHEPTVFRAVAMMATSDAASESVLVTWKTNSAAGIADNLESPGTIGERASRRTLTGTLESV
jgi:hypothetical protein